MTTHITSKTAESMPPTPGRPATPAEPVRTGRRSVLKAAAAIVGSKVLGVLDNPAYAAQPVQSLSFHITDALKNMVTHNAINTAQCYFWVFKEDRWPADCPGPIIFATYGDTIEITVTNDLDEPHALYIPGMFDTGPIAPGQTVTKSFIPARTGTFLYYDNLNEPVNRVMGLHGAFIVMPRAPVPGHKWTPYAVPTPAVQKLFDELGTAPWWPGLSWEQEDPATNTPGFRQYVWLVHQASPSLFAEVGDWPAGQIYPAAQFVQKFLHDPFSPTGNNGIPKYFTINGQSGHFGHINPYIGPANRVGEPVLIRCLNAGLWTHSLHIHANHVYVVAEHGIVQKNPLWVDTSSLHPLDTYDWVVPYHRPPDVPNVRGIGRADPGLPTLNGGNTWPPTEELNVWIPEIGDEIVEDIEGNEIDLAVQQSPLGYPMHDHSEPSQTAQGGNYNCGMMSGISFLGDRNTPGGVLDFPNIEEHHGHGPSETGPAAPEWHPSHG